MLLDQNIMTATCILQPRRQRWEIRQLPADSSMDTNKKARAFGNGLYLMKESNIWGVVKTSYSFLLDRLIAYSYEESGRKIHRARERSALSGHLPDKDLCSLVCQGSHLTCTLSIASYCVLAIDISLTNVMVE